MTDISLRQITADDLLDDESLHGKARIVHADPPWKYRAGKKGHGKAEDHYTTGGMDSIVRTLYRSSLLAAEDAYLLTWCTWPQIWDFITGWHVYQQAALDNEELEVARRWKPLTGGAWDKTNDERRGIGYHFLGECEPLLVFKLGKPKPIEQIGNCWQAPRRGHSEKPPAVLERIIDSLSDRDDLIVDLYAGDSASLAQVCLGLARPYVGAEADYKRARKAQLKAAQGQLFAPDRLEDLDAGREVDDGESPEQATDESGSPPASDEPKPSPSSKKTKRSGRKAPVNHPRPPKPKERADA